MKKFFMFFVAAAFIICCLVSLGLERDSGDLPELSGMGRITVIAREDGSGTKDAFKQLVGTAEEGANRIAASTNSVIEITAEDICAIGYAAYSTAAGAESVKMLSINGVAPSYSHISTGKYPLVRPYLLAYKGELSELAQDFIMYIRGAGQELVGEYITPSRKPTTFLSGKPEGRLRISGSSSVAPLMEELVKGYAAYNPGADITIEVSDSTGGINSALRGDCDMAMASRALKSYEAELLQTSVIGTDGVAVVVNPGNPLAGLTMKQLKSIYDGVAGAWDQLR